MRIDGHHGQFLGPICVGDRNESSAAATPMASEHESTQEPMSRRRLDSVWRDAMQSVCLCVCRGGSKVIFSQSFSVSSVPMCLTRVAIIGGGSAGLAAAKALASEPAKFTIDLFERRDKLGGLWYYAGDKHNVRPPVPSVNPKGKEISSGQERFFSPLYDQLETNLVSTLMEYNDVQFKKGTGLFPGRAEVYKYLEKYASTIPEGSIAYKYNTNVKLLKKANGVWDLQSEDLASSKVSDSQYDKIIVANGHFDLPYIPDVPGLAEWNEALPQSISHAKYFVNAAPFRDRRVVVVGNNASGVDVATQISTTAEVVFNSSRGEVNLIEVKNEAVKQIGEIKQYDHKTRSVTTVDGEVINDVDDVIFCTGYLYSFPFFNETWPDVTDGTQIKDIYEQIFNVEDPSISFLGILHYVVPMPLAEAQAAVVARVYSGRLQLPSVEERRKAYQEELTAKGPGRDFHGLKPPLDYQYCNHLYKWIADAGLDKEGLMPAWWDAKRREDRENAKALKDARLEEIVKHATNLRKQGKVFTLDGA